MLHTLTFEAQDGSIHTANYNAHTSELDGLTGADERDEWPVAPRVSAATPLGKSRAPRVLKIQLGLGCNFSCSYCSQAHQIHEATVSTLSDVDAFLIQLDGWMEGAPARIEFWGGEPFVYWAKIKRLIPALHERFPGAEFVIITNGSMFNRERLDWIIEYDIQLGISHDGPGQPLRGPDPLNNPEQRKWIETVLAERKGAVGFNVVLTRDNHDLAAIRDWFAERLGHDVPIGLEGVVSTYDAATLLGSGRFEKSVLNALSQSVFEMALDNPNAFGLGDRVQGFIQSLKERRPVTTLGQKCGMDRPEHIAVDLRGNVMTCQNTGAKGQHKIGHVEALEDAALDTSTHFAHRENCLKCPVVQLCQGSCMFLEGAFFDQSCKNEFALNFGIMRAALFQMSGMVLTKIESNPVGA